MASKWRPTEADCLSALESLYIDLDGSSPFTDDALFQEIACTLAEEIDHTQAFTYNPDASKDMSAVLETLLTSRGFQGSPKNRCDVLDFLTAEAQSSRLAAHASLAKDTNVESAPQKDERKDLDNPKVKPTSADECIAASISRICRCLGTNPDSVGATEQPADLVRIIDDVSANVAEAGSAGPGLGAPLLEPAQAKRLAETAVSDCTAIADALAQEHTLRKGLLMRRLEVTIQSFGYSHKAAEDGFDSIRRAVARSVQSSEQPVSVYDAFVAKEWLLDLERVSTSSASQASRDNAVKQVIMGSVPDRGGRVGSAARESPGMPNFAPRSKASVQNAGRKGKQRGRGRGRSSKK